MLAFLSDSVSVVFTSSSEDNNDRKSIESRSVIGVSQLLFIGQFHHGSELGDSSRLFGECGVHFAGVGGTSSNRSVRTRPCGFGWIFRGMGMILGASMGRRRPSFHLLCSG